jgi:hypothetical protein
LELLAKILRKSVGAKHKMISEEKLLNVKQRYRRNVDQGRKEGIMKIKSPSLF